MTRMRRPSPFSELVTLRQAMDRLFDDTVFRPFTGPDLARLQLDVKSTADALEVVAELPGAKPEDVEITIENGTLTIRAEDRSERTDEQGDWLVREISHGNVMRAVTLPTGLEADKADATFENGVLRLRIPRAEQAKPRQIQIKPVTNGEVKAVEAGSTSAAGTGGTGTAEG